MNLDSEYLEKGNRFGRDGSLFRIMNPLNEKQDVAENR